MRFETVLSLGLTFATGGLAAVLLLYAVGYLFIYRKLMKGTRRLPFGRLLFWGILLCYAFVVLSATIFYRFPSMEREPVYSLFYSYREAWIRWSAGSWRNILLNFCMFLPLGFLLPLGFQSLRKGWKVLILAFGSSLAIELLQLVTKRGMFEPDDLLGNTVGALIGYGIFLLGWQILSKIKKTPGVKWSKVLLAQLPLLLTAGAFLIIFACHYFRELGVHPYLPLDTINKKYLHVTSSLAFSPEETAGMVYQSRRLTTAEITSRGEEIFHSLGTSLRADRTDAYDNEVFLYSEDGNYSLILARQGGSYYLNNFSVLFPKEPDAPGLQERAEDQPADQTNADGASAALASANGMSTASANADGMSAASANADGMSAASANADDKSMAPASAAGISGASEAEIREALTAMGIGLPNASEVTFQEEGNGWYRFSYDIVPADGEVLMGFVSCDYRGSAGIASVRYQLIACTPVKEYPLISPREAYERIQNGKFNCYPYSFHDVPDEDFSTKKSHDLQITAFDVTYVCDSKGFYQPTYEFTGLMDGKELTIMIPAVK